MDIPEGIIKQNKMVMLMADIIFVNKVPFIKLYGRGVKLIRVEWIPNRTEKQPHCRGKKEIDSQATDRF